MATVTSVLALDDRMSPKLNQMERNGLATIQTFNSMSQSVDKLKKSLDAAERANPNIVNTQSYLQASSALEKMEAQAYDVANGVGTINEEIEKTDNKLLKVIGGFVSWAVVARGIKGLMDMSDTYSQTYARIDMMNDGLQTTKELQDAIYNSAQRAGVSYNSLADIVGKLGNQAKDAFGSSQEIVSFGEILNKSFRTAGMDASAIQSTMYNLTQSLASGKLLGNDYRILKQNAPQMIQYLQDFYKVSRAELDEMVTKGQITAQGIKSAMFAAADDINGKFAKMPITFQAVWAKFTNSLQKISEPILQIFSKVADGADKFFTFLSEHQYIIYLVIGAIGTMGAALLIYNTYQTITTIKQEILNSELLTTVAIVAGVALVIVALAGVLLYLWNTNDDVAYGMLYAWDALQLGVGAAVIGIKQFVLGMVTVVGGAIVAIVDLIQLAVNALQGFYNLGVTIGNALGGNGKKVEYADFGKKLGNQYGTFLNDYSTEIQGDAKNLINKTAQQNRTRNDRVANRTKIGMNTLDGVLPDYKSFANNLADVIGSDTTGGKAVKTTTDDKLISDEDIQLLLDVATRDYKLNYQQVTPNITLTFGDVRETADVDSILDRVADKLEEIYDGNLEVAYNG